MIYQDVKRFLKRHLQKPSSTYVWSGRDNLVLFNFIQSRFSDEQIDNGEMEIRQAFRDFYDPIGSLIIRFSRDAGANYKFFPYHVEPKNSSHLKNIIKIIQDNRRTIEYNYRGNDTQMALSGKIRRNINAEIAETNEAINKKELVRYAIKKALDLGENDIVLTLKKKYIIKLVAKREISESSYQIDNNENVEKEIQKVSEEEAKVDIEKSNLQELKDSYDEIFTEVDINDFLNGVMAPLFVGALNFDKINHNYYEKNTLRLIKNKIAEELTEYISNNSEYLSRLAVYIVKNNLVSIHERIAVEIFELISQRNENAKNFLNCYTGQIFVEDGKRYMIPEITTEDGKRWNINSLISISTIWLKYRLNLTKLRVELSNVTQAYIEIAPSYDEGLLEVENYNKKVTELLKTIKDVTKKIEGDTDKLKNELSGDKDNKTEVNLEHIMRDLKNIRNTHMIKLRDLRSVKAEVEMKFSQINQKHKELKANKKTLESKISVLDKDLTLNSNSFNSILSSVVIALMKRKKILDD